MKSKRQLVWGMKEKRGLQQNKYYSLLVITILRCFNGRMNIQHYIYFTESTFCLLNISYIGGVAR
jgi:hypothetical protein